ncbi:MAG: flagellar biosynthesis anti-sigma factor FlgM [Armatimonadetes bacterium]|nr:flagellar biosynthesis anti-sigma factor FlgM [Armatimonadota bacterium]
MKISTAQIEAILKQEEAPNAEKVDDAVIRLTDADLIKQVTQSVNEMPDREEMIADLKARIEAGTYKPSGDEIVDTMIRRAIADRVK